MTGDAQAGLAQLLHLRPSDVPAEQVGPGRQGGPLLVVIGISLVGLALWGWAEASLGWSVLALMVLGAALAMTGVGLASGLRTGSRPSTRANPPSADRRTRRSPARRLSLARKA